MPMISHTEQHFTASDSVRDMVIGMSDGLTVPFSLAAGLTGAISATGLIVTAGLAEIAAGSIAMGLGGYLATRREIEHYASERFREEREIIDRPEAECAEVAEVFRSYGLTAEEVAPLVEALRSRPKAWVDFMMRFELGLEEIDPKSARNSALTIAGAYVTGGLIPLVPYMLMKDTSLALLLSAGMTLAALFVFGFFKGHFNGVPPLCIALQTSLIGGVAAAAAFAIARAIS
jgi:VIT1/CCC1 family predicted Fe2+/Mn2+ transporter